MRYTSVFFYSSVKILWTHFTIQNSRLSCVKKTRVCVGTIDLNASYGHALFNARHMTHVCECPQCSIANLFGSKVLVCGPPPPSNSRERNWGLFWLTHEHRVHRLIDKKQMGIRSDNICFREPHTKGGCLLYYNCFDKRLITFNVKAEAYINVKIWSSVYILKIIDSENIL